MEEMYNDIQKEMDRAARWRWVLVVPMGLLLLIMLYLPAMATRYPVVNEILYGFSPELAQEYAQVRCIDSDNGITMAVVAASVRDREAELVVSIEGQMLARRTVSPEIKVKSYGAKVTTSVEPVSDYAGADADRENGIWYYRVTKTYPDDTPAEEILGDKITVSLRAVAVSDYAVDDAKTVKMDLVGNLTEGQWITVSTDAESDDYWENLGFESFVQSRNGEGAAPEECTVMLPGESIQDVTDKLAVTGVSYSDGLLHLQMAAVDGDTDGWNYGAYFEDGAGNRVMDSSSTTYSVQEDQTTQYCDRVFEIPQEELGLYTLQVYVEEYEICYFTDCEVTFQFSEMDCSK